MPRRKFVAGNWKMNPNTLVEAVALAEGVAKGPTDDTLTVGIFPPFPWLGALYTWFRALVFSKNRAPNHHLRHDESRASRRASAHLPPRTNESD